MKRVVGIGALFFCLSGGVGAYAHDASAVRGGAIKIKTEKVTVQQLINGVVKIVRDEGAILSAATNGAHGSGFVIGEDKEGRVLIFTNRHVIEGPELFVNRVSVEFNTDQRRPEVVDGEVIFVSRVHDFAVVAVDPKQLKRAKVQVLPLPSRESQLYDYFKNERQLRLHPAIAIGNPLDGSNITTQGAITGLKMNPVTGPFIQTDTAINPGNSGGPLISKETHEVVGINSAKYTMADGFGFAIPIGVVLDEFLTWVEQTRTGQKHTVGDPRSIGVHIKALDESQLEAFGLYDVIEKVMPGYWEANDAAILVAGTFAETTLEKGDILLTLNGQMIGGTAYTLTRLALMSGPEAVFKVLRKGNVVEVKAPIANLAYSERRRALDFVMLSGMFLQQVGEGERMMMRQDLTSKVVVGGLYSSPDTNFMGGMHYPPPGSVITAVIFGEKEYPVRNLFDLKMALNENRGARAVQVRGFRANYVHDGEGGAAQVRSPRTNAPFLDSTEDVFIIPMREVVTPLQFSLHQFMKQFSFNPQNWETRDWRDFIKKDRLPSSCEQALLAKGA